MSRKKFKMVTLDTNPRKSYTDDPRFGAALDREVSGSHRRTVRDRRATPIFNFAKRK